MNNVLSLAIVIVQIKFLEDDSAEMFVFWYPEKDHLPRTREERRLVLQDLHEGRCRKLNLIGSISQIEQILLSCCWDVTIRDTWFPGMEKAVAMAKQYRAIGMAFDNLLNPKGTKINRGQRLL